MKVFVYGTLRKHEGNHGLLKNAVPIAQQAWTYGELFDTGYGYPALKCSEQGKVYGELYEIDQTILSKLDHLEDYKANREDNLYERVEAQIFTDIGEYSGFVYIEKQEGLGKELILHGDWKLYQLLNQKPASIYYFAYGSCMDVERFEKAEVAHFFEKVEGACTLEGILYNIPFQGIYYLFDREGFNLGWYRPTLVDVKIGEKLIPDVLTFHVYEKQPELAPPLHYAKEILRGSKGRVSQGYYQKLEEELVRLGCKL